jgi:alkaline phosphatase D
MDLRLDRRDFVGYAGLGAGALILGGVPVDPALAARRKRRNRVPLAKGGGFPHGVASGEPAPRAITLWTRLDGFRRDRKLFLEVAKDAEFRRVVLRRRVRASAKRDHTVETRVSGKALKPGQEYFYRFETRNRSSEVGRFRTARPADSRQPVRIGFFSCQDYQAGFYAAHRAIAAEELDAVVCLGDYIYERNFYEGPRKDTLGPNGDGEVQTLPEYRQKYKLYRSDPDLQAMHASHAFMGIWDDHEVEDNWAGELPGEETGQVRVPFLDRRRNGFRAFYEYMPFAPVTNRPLRGHDLYRQLRLGRNLELFLLDQRQYRGDQPCGDQFFVPCPEAEGEARPFLGSEQLEWLKAGLQRSDASWRVIGSAVMAMALDTAGNQPINKDQWDGYGAERRELFEFVEARGVQNLALITGDIHTFFAGEVGTDGRGPESVATEFVGGSITSLGIPETVRGISGVPLTNEQNLLLTQQIRTVNPHLKYDEQLSRGFGLLEARPDELLVEFRAVDSQKQAAEARTIGRFRVASGTPRVEVL